MFQNFLKKYYVFIKMYIPKNIIIILLLPSVEFMFMFLFWDILLGVMRKFKLDWCDPTECE